MDLKQIEAFLAIVKHQNVTKAAEALFVSQSTISHRLKMLESELDTVLILRNKGISHIALSAKGAAFIPIANQWMEVYDRTRAFRESPEIKYIRIAAPESINNMLKAFYNEISSKEKNVRLSIQTCQSRDIAVLVEKQEVDVGFTYLLKENKNIAAQELGRQPMVILEKSKTPRACALVNPADLDPLKEVSVTGITRQVEPVVHWHNTWFDPHAQSHIQVDSPSMIMNSMSDGCWCLLTEAMAKTMTQLPDFHSYHLTEPAPDLICYKLVHKSPKPEVAEAVAMCHQYISSLCIPAL